MIGAIIGDVIGSVYEHRPIKTTDFPLFSNRSTFTDDTVLTVAVADSLLHGTSYAAAMKRYGRRYPHAGYGAAFYRWIFSESDAPYGSWGNGSAMRVSPIGYFFDTLEEVLSEAEKSAAVSHDHPEGIKGAQATAASVFLGRSGSTKTAIKAFIQDRFGYDLSGTVDQIRPWYGFDVSCQGTVPFAIIAFIDSTDYVDAVRKAVSLGGDSDTLACITGGVAEAFYREIPVSLVETAEKLLPGDLLRVVHEFENAHGFNAVER
jgi:ADP-ribosyl-[dinitrogen reductase] hydrolase